MLDAYFRTKLRPEKTGARDIPVEALALQASRGMSSGTRPYTTLGFVP